MKYQRVLWILGIVPLSGLGCTGPTFVHGSKKLCKVATVHRLNPGYYYCTKTKDNEKVTGVGKDKNGDNKFQEWGPDKNPTTDADNEIWCVQGDSPTNPRIPCPPWFKPKTEAEADCVENGGSWSQSGSVYQCTSADWDRVFFWEDLNGDEGIQIEEYWCEYKDANGNPDGVRKPCLEDADWE